MWVSTSTSLLFRAIYVQDNEHGANTTAQAECQRRVLSPAHEMSFSQCLTFLFKSFPPSASSQAHVANTHKDNHDDVCHCHTAPKVIRAENNSKLLKIQQVNTITKTKKRKLYVRIIDPYNRVRDDDA